MVCLPSIGISQSSCSPCTRTATIIVCEGVPSQSAESKSNEVETSQLEGGEKDDNDMDVTNELEKKKIDKDDNNGDDDLQSVEV